MTVTFADIQAARTRIAGAVDRTPTRYSRKLSQLTGAEVWVKFDNLQFTGSFKERGALNRLLMLSPEEMKRGVVAASAGNHAQALAYHGGRLGVPVTIVMPEGTPFAKINGTRSHGATVVIEGLDFTGSTEAAKRLEAEKGYVFVSAFDDPEVIAGQGTIGMEILRQCPRPPDAIYLAVGGGGLIAGVGAYVKALWPQVEIIGVEPVEADAMTRSLAAGERVRLERVGLFADGVAVREVGVETFRLCRQVVDRMVTVDTDAICAAIKDVFEDTRSILEPAGALAVAGLKAEAGQRPPGQLLVAVACGANMNFERLRFVAERAELGEQREAMLAVEIPEQPGSLRRFCRHLGGRSLTEFSYRRAEGARAHIFVGVRIEDRQDRRQLLETLTAAGFPCVDLSDDELAKLHLRHMVGGRRPRDAAAGAGQERLYRFEFPERPGALLDFVNALHPAWTISIFHYRNHGSDVGRIVVGVEVPEADGRAWEAVLTALGFPWREETANPAYRLFLA